MRIAVISFRQSYSNQNRTKNAAISAAFFYDCLCQLICCHYFFTSLSLFAVDAFSALLHTVLINELLNDDGGSLCVGQTAATQVVAC